jgi:predicted permease
MTLSGGRRTKTNVSIDRKRKDKIMIKKLMRSILAIVIISLTFAPLFIIIYLAGFSEIFTWSRGFALLSVSAFGCLLAGAAGEMEEENDRIGK